MSSSHQIEFSLHFFKRLPGGQKSERFTIGVWEGSRLRAICHDACMECAVAAIRREMEKAGRPRLVPDSEASVTEAQRPGAS